MSETLPVLGVVGLGAMGLPITRRLLEAGAEVHAADASTSALAEAGHAGALIHDSPREVADHAEVVLTSLPDGAAVLSVVEALARGSRRRAVIDLSTIGPQGSARVAEALRAAGVDYLDAPVSGGPAGALSGRLTIMAAASDEVFERYQPVLELLGSRILRVGDTPGHGQLAKVLNNLMSAASIGITAEALAIGVRGGLDPERLLEVINSSSGRNAASSDKFPQHVLPRTFDFGFRLRLMSKDVGLAISAAEASGVPTVLGSTVRGLWEIGSSTLPADSDCTEYVRMIESWSNVVIEKES